ncbi:MAG: hypothetical protein ACUZ8I_05365, partial [Candidatus Scalindua sp.]
MNRFIYIVLFIVISIAGCIPSEEKGNSISNVLTENKLRTVSVDGPAIEIVDKEIDLGAIPAEDKYIIGRIVFFNIGS